MEMGVEAVTAGRAVTEVMVAMAERVELEGMAGRVDRAIVRKIFRWDRRGQAAMAAMAVMAAREVRAEMAHAVETVATVGMADVAATAERSP